MPPQSLLRHVCRRSLLAGAAAAALSLGTVAAHAQDTLKLGLVAAMSGQSAKSGEAIVRGLSVAIDEVNAKGGLLGKKVELLVPERFQARHPKHRGEYFREPRVRRMGEGLELHGRRKVKDHTRSCAQRRMRSARSSNS